MLQCVSKPLKTQPDDSNEEGGGGGGSSYTLTRWIKYVFYLLLLFAIDINIVWNKLF